MRWPQGFPIAVSHCPLHLGSAPDCIHDAGELRQHSVASVLYDPAPVLGYLRVDQLPEVGLKPLVGPLLIRAHEARIPRHVGSEDRGEAADRGHLSRGGRLA